MTKNSDPNKQKLLQCIEEAVSAETKNSELLISYLKECAQVGVEVLPVDINASDVSCTFENEDTLRLGFSAFAPGGEQFLEDIVVERQENGRFKTFQDFCERVNLERIPSHFFLHGIEVGVFDSLGNSRARLFKGYEKIIHAVSKAKAEKAANQFSLFAPSQLAPPPLPKVEHWANDEIINHEKEAMGFSFTEYLQQSEEEEANDELENDGQSPVDDEPLKQDEVVGEKMNSQDSVVQEQEKRGTIDREETQEQLETSEEATNVVEEQQKSVEEHSSLETTMADLEEVEETPDSTEISETDTAVEKQIAKEKIEEQDNSPAEVESIDASIPYLDEEPPLPPEEFTAEEFESSFSEGYMPSASQPEQKPAEAKTPDETSSEPMPTEEQISSPSACIIQLATQTTTETTLRQLQRILEQSSGNVKVVFEFIDEHHNTTCVQAHDDYAVQLSEEFLATVENISGEHTTRILYEENEHET